MNKKSSIVSSRRTTILLVLAVAAVVGRFVRQNPLLFGRRIGASSNKSNLVIIRDHPVLDAVLEAHKSELGDDYEAYRNHCLRVLTFAVHHLEYTNGLLNEEYRTHYHTKQQLQRDIDVMALALAYHDIGLWTGKVLDYLDPSVDVMLKEQQLSSPDGDDDDTKNAWSAFELETAKQIILQHHKYTSWTIATADSSMFYSPHSPHDLTSQDWVVNSVRMADWADATMGVVRFGLTAEDMQAAYDAIPEAGFHKILSEMGSRLSPTSVLGQLDILKIFKW